ncbi:MAG: NAD(P)-dependent oxidoreductase, partial [Aquabacterium sp.]
MATVGFIGLGVMGTPMATHLARAGHALALHDIQPARAAELAARLAGQGLQVQAADDPAASGRDADIVVTMLPHGGVVQQVALGAGGLVETLRPGTVLLDCSSAEPWLTRSTAQALAGRGLAMVDAPVSGAQWGARDAQLVFMVGGADADVARVRPLLDAMGRAVHHLGPLGSGHTMKCLNNGVT